jgi:glycosyltransferase involved in cell wall biosynthesis
MSDIILTIAIPSIPSRMRMNLEPLFSRLMSQIGSRKDIQVISVLDNKSMSIAQKRKYLLSMASGKYCTFLDDDDQFAPSYIQDVADAITSNDVDVICYDQQAFIEGVEYLVTTSLKYQPNLMGKDTFEQLPQNPRDASGKLIPCHRPPWIWCAWKTELIRSINFGDTSFGEDGLFVENASAKAKTEYKIDKPLHIYRWSRSTTSVTAPWGNS